MDALLRRLSVKQLTEWMAFAELEPFGPGREDLRAGVLAAVTANSAFGRGKGAKSYKPSDFFETLKPPTKRMSADELAAEAKRMTRSMGGRVVTRAEALALDRAEREREERRQAAMQKHAEKRPKPKPKSKGK